MGDAKSIKERGILEQVIKSELDFITYVDVHTGAFHVIVTNDDTDVTPPPEGDYTQVNAQMIPLYVHPKDREACAAALELPHILSELEQRDDLVVSYRLLCGEVYRRKELHISYRQDDRGTVVLVRRDVTESYEEEQRQQERLMSALSDARHANQEKNEFLERMSHEIRTPMNSIIGLTYLTREYVNNEKQVLENLDKISQSARFMLSFVDDILNLSQIESGNVALNSQKVVLDAFLEETVEEAMRQAAERRVHFAVDRRGSFDATYCFDAEKLGRALSNILENAVKYTMPDGRVDFIVEHTGDDGEDAGFRFEIRDTGVGMDEAFIPHMFEPFEQEDEGITTLNGGTGLGLPIARNIIEFMGGHIEAYSEKGKGSTFIVNVNLKRVRNSGEKLRGQGAVQAPDYDFTGKRALLVEDNEVNIEITRNILLHKNLQVDVAVNGEEGVTHFLSHEPGYYDVILMDIRMPVMDGLTATRKIRESGREDGKTVPIVAMTANVFEEDVRKSLDAGMDAHLSKPIEITQMYAVLDSMIYR